jgi:hypothetical protein
MPNVVGTHDISTLLAARFQSVAEFGMDTIAQVLAADLAVHNALTMSMVGVLCEITTDRQRIYGTAAEGEMYEVDEYGRAPTQVSRPGDTVGFPLKLYQFALGWTRKWLETRTPADMATAVIAAERANVLSLRNELKKAIYLSSNFTFNDHLVDKVDLSVKRLVNADSAAIPPGPNGEEFDGATHTHYNAEASLTAANVIVSINDLVEHGHGGAVKMYISRTDEAAFKALTGFEAYVDPRIIYRASDTPGQALDITRLDNRAIGIFDAAEVWVKPWAIANYAFIHDAGSPSKTLAYRQRGATALQGLRIAAELDDYPLMARYMEAEFGLGVWTRTNGVVHYFNGGAYVDPTI